MRTHNCGELRAKYAGEQVKLAGWVHHKRHHGGVLFVDLRDRYGRIQLTFRPEAAELFERAEKLGHETVISIDGTVLVRPPEARNPEMPTGEVEVIVERLEILSRAETPPFVIEDDVNASEETRLKYRYLDLRRPEMQSATVLRSNANRITRDFLFGEDFLEIETATLVRSTPEGARDFLVPSRMQRGKFYALPQSPQVYKQLLMIAGFDRYFQLARCYRDEDLRADRQLEFTQIDIEMSFVDEDDVLDLAERLTARLMSELCGVTLKLPLPRIPYDEAMRLYGSDKPDLRFGLEIHDITEAVKSSEFKVFSGAKAVRGIAVPKAAGFSRKQIDELTAKAQKLGAKGLAQMKFEGGELSGGIAKFLSEGELSAIRAEFAPEDGSMLIFVADKVEICERVLGALRVDLAKSLDLIPKDKWEAHFVVDFPMFEVEEDTGRLVARHHAFTQPKPEDVHLLETDPKRVRARAYDLVLNGHEIAGGSIRTHNSELLARVLSVIELTEDKAREKFGFLLDAMKYGAPPHGGIAFGYDRMMMLFAGMNSIRDVIAFPKTTAGQSLMDNCPNTVDEEQLKDLGIKLNEEKIVR